MPRKKSDHRSSRRQRRRARRAERQKVPKTVLAGLIVLFLIGFGMLVQQAVIISLDRDVNDLQSAVKAQQAINDSKEGKIISGRNLDKIEEKARSYGMTEPKQSQYQYVVVTENDSDSSPFAVFKARISAFVKKIQSFNSGDAHDKTSKKSQKTTS